MGNLQDKLGPQTYSNNGVEEPAVITTRPDPGKISQALKDELAELMVVRATCPDCGSTGYYAAPPRTVVEWDCDNPGCNTTLQFDR